LLSRNLEVVNVKPAWKCFLHNLQESILRSRVSTRGANPTTTSYNYGAVKIYNATTNLLCVLRTKILFLLQCKTHKPAIYNTGLVAANTSFVVLDSTMKKCTIQYQRGLFFRYRFLFFCTNTVAYYNCRVVDVDAAVAGLAPCLHFMKLFWQ
jgi:hypothetical protein